MAQNWQNELQTNNLIWTPNMNNLFNAELVQKYYNFLNENPFFFSKQDRTRILERHLYESLIFCLRLQNYIQDNGINGVSRETNYLDAGSGPGLPGFLFSCLQSPPKLTLLDSSKRKLGKLAHWVQKEGFGNKYSPRFSFERLEEHRGTYTCIITRAFLPFPFAIELGCHLQKKGGIWALFTSSIENSDETIKYIKKLGYVIRDIQKLIELQNLGLRQILILEKVQNTQAPYPRDWKILKKICNERRED